jgi:1-deoxy-D-xylulose-5-phosphate reductoisomerase
MKHIAILGSTGSIGSQTLEVIQEHPDKFKLIAIAAGSNVKKIIEQCRLFKPNLVSVASKEIAEQVRSYLPFGTAITYGTEGLLEVATHPQVDILLTAVVGSVGLRPTLAAIEAGKTIAIANKETLVSAGHLVLQKAKQHNVPLLPVDSEHSAIFQCLQGEDFRAVEEIILTASGGSFRNKEREELKNVTVAEALKHPNWSMGAKITIDSATMMNKGLEVIEAHWLFDLPFDKIKVILHEESIIHSMVVFQDHAVMAQLGTPDMKVPIQYALSYPNRLPSSSQKLNLVEIGKLHFRELRYERYPCVQMAYEAGILGGTMTTVLNAANEVAVARFLGNEISFLQIEDVIYKTLEQHNYIVTPSLQEIEEVDVWARKIAHTV